MATKGLKEKMTEKMTTEVVTSYGKDQLQWIDTYGEINLSHWRMLLIPNWNKMPDWYYVGEWKPTRIEPYPGPDGGYSDRFRKLTRDKFHYWHKT